MVYSSFDAFQCLSGGDLYVQVHVCVCAFYVCSVTSFGQSELSGQPTGRSHPQFSAEKERERKNNIWSSSPPSSSSPLIYAMKAPNRSLSFCPPSFFTCGVARRPTNTRLHTHTQRALSFSFPRLLTAALSLHVDRRRRLLPLTWPVGKHWGLLC